MNLHIKKCKTDQLQELIHISKKTFVDAFEAENNPEDFKTYIEIAFKKEKILRELQNPNSYFYFVYYDDIITGYFKLNEWDAQTDIKEKNSLELERIYVSQEFQSKRIGEWMLGKVKTLANKMQKEYIWLGVWEHNEKAIRFYERHGFSKFGTHPYFIGRDEQTDWLLRYDLKYD